MTHSLKTAAAIDDAIDAAIKLGLTDIAERLRLIAARLALSVAAGSSRI
jgi:hypothetical protein